MNSFFIICVFFDLSLSCNNPSFRIYLNFVLSNLLTNAIKFTPKNGEINIGLEQFKNEVKISLSDTGKGFSAGQILQINNHHNHSAAL